MAFTRAFSDYTASAVAAGVTGREGREVVPTTAVEGLLAVAASGKTPDVVAVAVALTTGGGMGTTGGSIGPLGSSAGGGTGGVGAVGAAAC